MGESMYRVNPLRRSSSIKRPL